MHDVVPFAFTQVAPQAPQFEESVSVLVSQPLAALPSQLAAPALHEGVQTPDTQEVVPWGLAHVAPHAPQFEVVLSEVSQPEMALLSQSPKPGRAGDPAGTENTRRSSVGAVADRSAHAAVARARACVALAAVAGLAVTVAESDGAAHEDAGA